MGRGGRTSVKQSNRPLRRKMGDSEDSDEDYVAEVDEQSDDMDFLGAALEEESCFEEDDGRNGGWRTVVKLKPRTKPRTKRKRKRKTKPKPLARDKTGISRSRNNGVNRPNKKRKITCHDDNDDDDDSGSDDDDDDDVEFTPDEYEYLEEEEKDDEEGEDDDDGDEEDDDDDEEVLRKANTKKRGRTAVKRKKTVKYEGDDDDEEEEELPKAGKCEDDDDGDDDDEDEEEELPKANTKKRGRAAVKRKKVVKYEDEDDDDDEEEEEEELPKAVKYEDDGDEDDEDDDDEEELPKVNTKKRGRAAVKRKNAVKYEDDDDDDEELPKANTKKRGRTTVKRKKPVKSKRNRGANASNKPSKKRSRRTSSSRKVANFVDDEEFMEEGPALRGRARKYPLRRKKLVIDESNSESCSDSSRSPLRRKKLVIDESNSESDSDSSDCEFTISEEEMEQIREANVICRTGATDLRSTRKHQKDEVFREPKKPPARKKGKEKAEETKNDTGKPVCGICLTEEGKTTVPGTLNCCSHYFCFACIMEWSKVETRCPLCKQRFVTISKPTKCGKGFDLRNSMVTVPERDQVYQPSEEELRDFLNPYENVICTECNQGGDDALMLLCDVCDSPAHTYCVGLGREVPEGNWYCDGCRPAALASLSQAQDLVRDQRSGASASDRQSSIYENMAEIDLNVSIPETPLSHGDGFSSPRFSGGNFQLPSPVSGMGVSTVFGRRRIHRQIRHILSNRLSQNGGEISSLGNMMGFGVSTSPFRSSRTDEGTSHHAHGLQSTDFGYSRQTLTPIDGSTHPHRAWGGLESINLEDSQVPPIGPDTGRFSSGNWDGEHTDSVETEVHSIVRDQVQRMSRDMNLGRDACLEISRRSVHTIMAAYGLEPRRHDTHIIQPPICVHLDGLRNTETSPLHGCCLACFRSFVVVVVERMTTDITMAPHWHYLRH